MELLLKYSAYMRVRGVYSKGDRSTRFRVSKYRDRGQELLGKDGGGVELRSPQERLAQTLDHVGVTRTYVGSGSEEWN